MSRYDVGSGTLQCENIIKLLSCEGLSLLLIMQFQAVLPFFTFAEVACNATTVTHIAKRLNSSERATCLWEGRIGAKPQGRGRKEKEGRKRRPEATFIFVYFVTDRPRLYNSD